MDIYIATEKGALKDIIQSLSNGHHVDTLSRVQFLFSLCF
jgi:hypothetical protein